MPRWLSLCVLCLVGSLATDASAQIANNPPAFGEAQQAFSKLSLDKRYDAQRLLGIAGYFPYVSSGQLGKRLFTAVQRFQTENSLPITGRFSPDDFAKLSEVTATLLTRWGLAEVRHPAAPFRVWVPAGLGLTRSTTSDGYAYRSTDGLIKIQFGYLPGADLAATYAAIKVPPPGNSPGFITIKAPFFVVSYGEDGGATTYIRAAKIAGGLAYFKIVWAQEPALHGERLATLISDLFRASTENSDNRPPPSPPKQGSPVSQPENGPAVGMIAAATTIAPASPAIEIQHRVALVIGNSAYQSVASLPNPAKDVALVGEALRRAGIEVTITLDLDRVGMVQALRAFAQRADAADWAMIYYAGHGIEVGGTNYLIPIDAQLRSARDVPDEAISLQRLLSATEGAKKLRLVVLDACRNNPFAQQMKTANVNRAVSRGLARVEPENGTLVIYAAKEGTTADDGDGANSPFATSFAKRLTEPGIEIGMTFRLVRQDVMKATGNRQEPFTYGSLPPEGLYFAGNR